MRLTVSESATETPASQSEIHGSQSELTVIEPTGGWRAVDLAELWRYRELLYFLVWRDVKVKYKQTGLGAAWAVIQPITAMVVFTFFFGNLARMPSDGLPYPIFAYAGLLPWNYFASAVAGSGQSLVASANLLTKVYFPRLVIPLGRVASGLVDFAIAFAVLLVLMLYYGIAPTATLLVLPALLVMAVATALGMGLWLSALNVQYRDVGHVIPFLVQIWMFATPVVYPASLLPDQWRVLYGLNPMAGVVEGFRWALLGARAPAPAMLAVSAAVIVLVLISGLLYFRRMEDTFADVV